MSGLEWVTGQTITEVRMNQKTLTVKAAEPDDMYAGMLWFVTGDEKLQERNAANNGWIERPGVTLAATISGLWTFDRGAAPPFAVDALSQKVTNLDADKLDGQSRVLKIDADHDHEGAGAEGGTLDVAAIAAGILAVARGGTGLGAYAQGGILYISAANTLSRLAPAAANRVLRSTGANALEFGVLVVGDIPTLTTGKLSDVPAAAWATIFSNAFAIATVLTDHDKAAHDALDIDSDTLDTFHATSFPRLRDTEKNLELDGVGETEICAYTIDGTDRIMRVATFFRVITGATVVTVTVKYTNILAQAVTCTLVDAKTLAVGDYTYAPLIFEIDASTEITLNITASVANRVFASGTIEELV